jgi:tetratricopeptide (TPR) repeat protein
MDRPSIHSEEKMDAALLILLIGFLYIVVFGGLSLLRREGLSMRFAIESLVITVVITGLTWAANLAIPPVMFLLLIYVLTMRVRLLVDIANFFARRGNYATAERVYHLACQFWTDPTNRLIVAVNQGALRLHQGALDEAISIFKTILAQEEHGFLGIRYESAAHYNLGVAYQRKGLESLAIAEFNHVLDIWPASEYARAASNAIARHQKNPDSH